VIKVIGWIFWSSIAFALAYGCYKVAGISKVQWMMYAWYAQVVMWCFTGLISIDNARLCWQIWQIDKWMEKHK
jgi:hypothetical protein